MRIRKLPWGRIIASIVAGAFFGVAICDLPGYLQLRRHVRAGYAAEPIHLNVDLSQPGEYTGDFTQTLSICHGEQLRVQIDRAFASQEEAEAIVEGFSGRLVMTAASGGTAVEQDITSKSFFPWTVQYDPELFLPALDLDSSLPTGQYRLNLTVKHGAPALAGVPHALVARYFLCGLEWQMVGMVGAFVVACFLVGGVLMLAVLWVTVKKRRAHRKLTP